MKNAPDPGAFLQHVMFDAVQREQVQRIHEIEPYFSAEPLMNPRLPLYRASGTNASPAFHCDVSAPVPIASRSSS